MSEDVNILTVDDVAENLVALAVLLKRPGLRLIQARSGSEALEALLANDIALALLDVHMPGMDGFELAELMHGSQRTREVPIIFLTAALPDKSRVFQGYEAGAVDFLFKPLDPHLLVSKVEVFAKLHRQRRELARQVEQIRQAQAMSDLFVGVLGHDLRNPLSTIVTGATLLDRVPDDAAATRKRAGAILRASERMERLIQQVLDFARARVKGGIPVVLDDTDLGALVRSAVSDQGPSIAKRVETVFVGDTLGRWDADRLMQIVSNLLSNAAEHGDPSTPIRIRVDGSAADVVELEVHNGGAIPPERIDVLFSPFKQRDPRSRGLGLGLYIVDQIVSAHGGRVSVASAPTAGTTFVVALPRVPITSPSDTGRASR